MCKIIALCGKICSGKTVYARSLLAKEPAVLLSCDELTSQLFHNQLGDQHDLIAQRIWTYFYQKGAEIVQAGCSVIFDWGFWNREQRTALRDYCQTHHIPCEWHYVQVTPEQWETNIQQRNALVQAGKGEDAFYLDDGLKQKLLTLWEEPTSDEIDVWYSPFNQTPVSNHHQQQP